MTMTMHLHSTRARPRSNRRRVRQLTDERFHRLPSFHALHCLTVQVNAGTQHYLSRTTTTTVTTVTTTTTTTTTTTPVLTPYPLRPHPSLHVSCVSSSTPSHHQMQSAHRLPRRTCLADAAQVTRTRTRCASAVGASATSISLHSCCCAVQSCCLTYLLQMQLHGSRLRHVTRGRQQLARPPQPTEALAEFGDWMATSECSPVR